VADFFIRAQTGRPYNAVLGLDRANVGRTYQRPDAVGNPNHGLKTPDQWFDTSMFAMPALYTYGSSGAFTVEGDSRFTFDFSAGKRFFPHGERHWVEFRGEFYNLTNTVRLGDPTMTFTSSSFGKITTAVPARHVQLALRYSF